jgi:diphthine methyl ester acylhydrolase
MHAGSRVVRLGKDGYGAWRFEIIARFEEHQSMNYGSDVRPGDDGSVKVVVSTSFYDKLLCIWRADIA